MKTVYKYIKLPLFFDADAMLQEVKLLEDVWLAHYNTRDYTGEWKAIPLRSLGGSTTQAVAMQMGAAEYLDTMFLDRCCYVRKVIESFLCEKTSVRILNLRPGAVVKPHKDPGLSYEAGEVRIHIPICTNAFTEFYIEDDLLKPMPGECWYMNFELSHRLANNGDDDRIHLVIDCVVNDWVKELFANTNTIATVTDINDDIAAGDKVKMIEALRNMGTEVSLEIALKLENELNNTNHGV